MNNFVGIPATVSTRDIQRNYTSVFNLASATNQPILVISNNKPRAVIISPDAYNEYANYLASKKLCKKQ